MTDHPDIVERLNEFVALDGGDIADVEEAVAEITRLRAEAEALRKALADIVDKDLRFFDGYVDRYLISHGEIWQARAAIAATKEQQA